jgi:hypothetical protein
VVASYSSYCPGIILEGLRKTLKKLSKTVGAPAEIGTKRNRQKLNLGLYRYTSLMISTWQWYKGTPLIEFI